MTHAILIAAFAFAAILQVVAILVDPSTRIVFRGNGTAIPVKQWLTTTLIAVGVIIASVASIASLIWP